METFDCIKQRRSCRDFNDTPVEWEKVGNIIHAGQLAPSSGNVQDYKFVIVTDKTKRAAIANAALKQHWMAKAPVIIIIYSEPKHSKRFYGLRGEKLYTIQNAAASAENMVLAATDQGLASCWVGAFDEVMVNRVLGAPNDVRPQIIIPIGYSDREPKMPKRYRMVDVVYINAWKGKIVNIDLVFDDFSNVTRKKVTELVGFVAEKAPSMGQKLADKGKEHIKKIQDKIKSAADERKRKKEEKLAKEIGDEEEVLEDTEDLE